MSESRGGEATGLVILKTNELLVYKEALPASKFIKTDTYRYLAEKDEGGIHIAMGHDRLVTNGVANDNNNQPVIKDEIIGVHNGIVVNDKQIWANYPNLSRETSVDTEIILSLISLNYKKNNNIVTSVYQTFNQIEGTASIALLFSETQDCLLATNNGSIYYIKENNIFVFASEGNILKQLNKKIKKDYPITNLKPGTGLFIKRMDSKIIPFSFNQKNPITLSVKNKIIINKLKPKFENNKDFPKKQIFSHQLFKTDSTKIPSIKKCNKCILPATMPFIEFDEEGICNYCHNYKKVILKKIKDLELQLPRNSNNANCIVPLSGGRDSCYGLHYIKKELGLTPIAFSYDWGMITDLGRRNQARMCGRLGIEHILISADIKRKRRNIRNNLIAWIKKPDLGTIPLFMAGDKQYFYHLNSLKKTLGLKTIFYTENPLEKTDFKSGFCGIPPHFNIDHVYDFSVINKLKLAFYYGRQFIRNPNLINKSLADTISAYISSYFTPHNYIYLFRYIKWDEEIINKILREEYDWELAPDTKTTWRIGDGTAAFYNYIYYTVAGFTENDTFRSNQVREGMITRDQALALAERDNQPRWESIKWYCDTIKIDYDLTIKKINSINKLY